ncbi:MAG: recombinase family protein [Bdellovibrionota bacterium]
MFSRSKRASSISSMVAVLYARVSSREQEEGFSIDAQLSLLRKYALEKGFEVVSEFVDVETARATGRTKFGEMLAFIRRSPLPVNLLVEKTDRAYRNLKDYTTLDDLVREKDVRVHLVKESEILGREASSHSRFIHEIKVLMAKNYVENLSEEVRKGQQKKAESGQFPSIPPLGYRWNRQKRCLVQDPKEAPFVRKVFEKYATGRYSMAAVADLVSRGGLRTRTGRELNKRGVEIVVKNPIYYGEFYWSGKLYKGNFDPIVTRDLWDAAQVQLRRQNRPESYYKHDFPYRGLLKCAKCGWAVTAEIKKGKYVYYHCGNSPSTCERAYVRQEVLEAVLREKITALYVPDDMALLLQKALDEAEAKWEGESATGRVSLEKKAAELKNHLDRLYTDHVTGKIDEDFFKGKWNAWRSELSRIENDLARKGGGLSSAHKHLRNVIELCNRLKSLYDCGNHHFRAELAEVVSSNLALDGTSVRFDYRFPFNLMAENGGSHIWRRG